MPAMSWGDEFAGRRVVITGACGIYGRWIARAFADVGARLCLSDIRGEALSALAAELRIFERGGLTHRTDLLDAASIDDLVATVAKAWTAADVVINILARQRDPGPPETILTPAALTLRHAPVADCARYDNLRRTV